MFLKGILHFATRRHRKLVEVFSRRTRSVGTNSWKISCSSRSTAPSSLSYQFTAVSCMFPKSISRNNFVLFLARVNIHLIFPSVTRCFEHFVINLRFLKNVWSWFQKLFDICFVGPFGLRTFAEVSLSRVRQVFFFFFLSTCWYFGPASGIALFANAT